MFRKPYKVKSSTGLRSSIRHEILARVPQSLAKHFDSFQRWSMQSIQSEFHIKVYMCDKCPFFIELEAMIFPTVYSLWLSPFSYPILFVYSSVFERLQNGADLMLPGIINNDAASLPSISVGQAVAIAIYTESGVKGPAAVGKALMSSKEMLDSGMKGRGVQIMHFYQDLLWESGSKVPIPFYSHEKFFPVADNASKKMNVIETTDHGSIPSADTVDGDESVLHNANDTDPVVHNDPDSEADDIEEAKHKQISEMEDLLRQTFLAAVHYKVDKEKCTFPIDAGQFYANFVLKNLPSGQRIEMKKTKYKKFSNFLRQINDELADNGWVVKIITKKGIDSIEELNFEHPAVKSAEFSSANMALSPVSISALNLDGKVSRIKVSECFSVTEKMLPFFRAISSSMIRRGDILQQNKIRDLVLEYANAKNLLRDGNKVELDDTLQSIVKHFLPTAFPINDVVQKITSQLTNCFSISSEDGTFERIRKGKLPLIELKVEKRSGNKVVTLISNINVFGINEKQLCQRIQNTMATGTSITPTAPNCDGPQILVHGNKVNFIAEDLINVYGIQKKFLKGLELGVKEKKKKK